MRVDNKEIIDYKGMGIRIKEKRLNAGISIKQLSIFSNIDEASLSNIERGAKRSGLTSLVLIARALAVTTDYLLFGSDSSNGMDKCDIGLGFSLSHCDESEKKAIYEVVSTMVKAFKKDN